MITKEAKNIKNAQFHRVYFNSARANRLLYSVKIYE